MFLLSKDNLNLSIYKLSDTSTIIISIQPILYTTKTNFITKSQPHLQTPTKLTIIIPLQNI